jgi:hypothetical protein
VIIKNNFIKGDKNMNKELTMKKESMTTKVGGFLNRNSMYIALALMCAMCMGSTVFAVDALWNTLAGLIETWVTRLGAVVMLVGGVMFGLGWKSDDAEQKSRGISTIIAGAIVMAVAALTSTFFA